LTELGRTAPPVLLTVDQVAAHLQVSRWTVHNLIRSRELASVTIGRCRRISESARGELVRAATKTARSTRRVPLPAECATALRSRRAQQHADRLARGDKCTTTDLGKGPTLGRSWKSSGTARSA
jgi:excisionase family DNA binding protein